jgi:hypothetical protein
MMKAKIMTLQRAKLNVEFPEFSQILIYESWLCFTDIEYEALEYLIQHSSRIMLPNVKALTEDKLLLLKNYNGYLEIGVQ